MHGFMCMSLFLLNVFMSTFCLFVCPSLSHLVFSPVSIRPFGGEYSILSWMEQYTQRYDPCCLFMFTCIGVSTSAQQCASPCFSEVHVHSCQSTGQRKKQTLIVLQISLRVIRRHLSKGQLFEWECVKERYRKAETRGWNKSTVRWNENSAYADLCRVPCDGGFCQFTASVVLVVCVTENE